MRYGRGCFSCVAVTLAATLGGSHVVPSAWGRRRANRSITERPRPKSSSGATFLRPTFRSANETMSCATCHEQARGFNRRQENRRRHYRRGSANAIPLALADVAYLPTLTWGNSANRIIGSSGLIPIFREHPWKWAWQARRRCSSKDCVPILLIKSFRRRVSRGASLAGAEQFVYAIDGDQGHRRVSAYLDYR